MASYLPNLYTALRTRIATVWPDVLGTGSSGAPAIWEAEDISLIDWEYNAAQYLPFAVIHVASFDPADMAADSQCYLARVDLYRVQAVDGPSGTLITNLESLRDDLWTNDLTTGQVWPEPPMSLDWSMRLPANRVFAEKGEMIRAGKLSVSILVGEGP